MENFTTDESNEKAFFDAVRRRDMRARLNDFFIESAWNRQIDESVAARARSEMNLALGGCHGSI